MSKKMNLVYSHKKEADATRIELAKIKAGNQQTNAGTAGDAMCECGDSVFEGYSNLVETNKPAPKPKPEPTPDPTDLSCDCGWGLQVILMLWV